MAESVYWNRGACFRELPESGGRAIFVAPQRLSSFAALVFALFCGAFGIAAFIALPAPCGFLFIVLIVAGVGFLVAALVTVWTQIALEVDPQAREIALITKRPWGLRRDACAFDRIRRIGVEVDQSEPDDSSDPEWSATVWLDVDDAIHVVLCIDDRDKATLFAKRIATLIGVECR